MKSILLVLAIGVFSISCTETKREIESEVQKVARTSDREELRQRTKEILAESSKLTPDQKESFLELHDEVVEQVESIEDRMRKLKIVLVQHLAQQEYSKRKVSELKRQLKKLNNEKFDVMIDAMSDAREILGVEFKNIHPRHGYDWHGSMR